MFAQKQYCLLALFPLVVAAIFYPLSVAASWHDAAEDIMGTRVSVELWDEDAKHAELAIQSVMADMRAVDAAMSPYIASSYVSQLNKYAAKKPVAVSADVFPDRKITLLFKNQQWRF